MKYLLYLFLLPLSVVLAANLVSAAPYFNSTRTIIPEQDSSFDVGTSTKAYRDAFFDRICLNGDCQTAWSAGGGEANTASSLGTGINLYDSKSGVDLRFNTISAGSNITISTTSNNNTLVINSTGGGGGSGTVSTSSAETSTYIPFWTSTGATPATLSGGESTFTYNATDNRLTVTYASTTALTVSGAASTTDLVISGLGTGSNRIVTVNGSGVVSSVAIPLTYANGGGGTISNSTGALAYYGATSLQNVATSSATLNLGLSGSIIGVGTGQSLSIATSSLYTGTTGQFPYFSGANTITATSSLQIGTTGFVTANNGFLINRNGAGTQIPLTIANSGTGGTTVLQFTTADGLDTPYYSHITSVGGATGKALSFYTNSTTANTLGTERLTILSAGNIGMGTTSPGTSLSIGNTGNDTINISTTATSTFGSGINIRTGCFAVNGTCVSGGGGSGTVNSGTTGQFPYYAGNGTTLTATSSVFVATNENVGIGTTTPAKDFSVTGESLVSATSTSYGLNVFGASGTSTAYIYSTTAARGGRIILEDVDAAGCTEITTLNGTVSGAVVTCPTEF